MVSSLIGPQDAEELKRLLEEYVTATLRGADILKKHVMNSQEFRDADKATAALWVRIREIQGLSGEHWMS